uniref:Uncharacterized protein n=2 Tax=Amphimedon queenslandica TaxID=400682 RepID=A0A1X7VEE8_AMPQE
MASPQTVSDHLSSFLNEKGQDRDVKLIQFLQSFLITLAEGKDVTSCFASNDPHSVLSILIDSLLNRFTSMLVNGTATTPTSNSNSNSPDSDHTSLSPPTLSKDEEAASLKKFLYREDILLLLATIHHMCTQVDLSNYDLVELLLVVLRSLLPLVRRNTDELNLFLSISPSYSHSRRRSQPHPLSPSYRITSELKRNSLPAIGPEATEWIPETLLSNQSLSSSLDDVKLFLLVLGVIEGLTCSSVPKNNHQISQLIRFLSKLTDFLEEVQLVWIETRNAGEEDIPSSFLASSLFARYLLRVWLILINNTSESLLSPSHTFELRSLLPRPITMATKAPMRLGKGLIFTTNRYLDGELSLLFLESVYTSVVAINALSFSEAPPFSTPPTVLSPGSVLLPPDALLNVLNESIFDSSQEWLLYVCSKLQSLPRIMATWDSVVTAAHCLLGRLMRELVCISDLIQAGSRQELAAHNKLEDEEEEEEEKEVPSARSFLREGYVEMEQRLCKISQSLLVVFESVPSIQLLSLQLLAQTGLDKIGIISDFLPHISHSSVWSMPEVLDLYLELLEKAWLQLSPDSSTTPEFWTKVSNYVTALREGSHQTVLQVMFHLLFLFSSHSSCHLLSSLTQHVILPYHKMILERMRHKLDSNKRREEKGETSEERERREEASEGKKSRNEERVTESCFEIEEEKVIHLYLKLLQKVASHPSSLVPFLEGHKSNLFSLFVFVPLSQFRSETLAIFCNVLRTLSRPWESSIIHSSHLSGNKTHLQLVNALLQIAYEFNARVLLEKCNKLINSGGETDNITKPFDLRKIDQIHVQIQHLLDETNISQLATAPLVSHLQLVSDVWCILVEATSTCDGILVLMNENHIWDVIQVLAPSLASLLERVWIWSGKGEGSNVFSKLREVCVSLLCHLLSMATIVCRVRENPSKVLEFHCSEVHSFLHGSKLCTASNSSQYIATLLKTATFYSPEPSSAPVSPRRSSSGPGHNHSLKPTRSPSHRSRHSSSRGSTSKISPSRNSLHSSHGSAKGSPILSRRQSKIRPLTLPSDTKVTRKPIKLISPTVALSPSNRLHPFFPAVIDGESDYSGYDADTEFGGRARAGSLWSEGGTPEEPIGEEEERVAGSGFGLHSPVTTVKVPEDIKKRLWLEGPVWQCLELLKECVEDATTKTQCDSALELFLAYLLDLLKADNFNISLLARKGILGFLLDSFSNLFDSKTERSKNCSKLLCQLVEVLASYQVSHSDLRKLFLKLQGNKENLEQLVSMLYKVAKQNSHNRQPSSYIEFSFPRPSMKLSWSEMLRLPCPQSTSLHHCALSMWLYIGKYPLESYFHLLSLLTGEVYVQLWASPCSGDIVVTFSDQIKHTCLDDASGANSVTSGSALTLNSFHHLYISIKYSSRLCQVEIVIDGGDVFNYTLNLSSSLAQYNEGYCGIGGGVVSNITSERHIKLVNADKMSLKWRLGSLNIFDGSYDTNLASLLYQLGPESPPSCIGELGDILTSSYVEMASDSTEVKQIGITDSQLQAIQWPVVSYWAHQSQKVYFVSLKETKRETDPHNPSSSSDSIIVRIPSVDQLQWVATASPINQPQLFDVLLNCIGLEQLLYLYAKTVSKGCSDIAQFHTLSLIQLTVHHSPQAKLEFRQLKGITLLQQVLRTSKAALTRNIAKVFLDWACGPERIEIKHTDILEHILLDWHIWCRSPVEVWQMLLWQLEQLLSPENSHSELNRNHFLAAEALKKILLTSKERRSLESNEPLDSSISMIFVRLIALLLGDPPHEAWLKYVWDHLLLPDLNDAKLVRGDINLSLVETSKLPKCSPSQSMSSLESHSAGKLGDRASLGGGGGGGRDEGGEETEKHDNESESDMEVVEFDVQSLAGRLPDSSYSDLETLFTWTDITGLPFLNDSDIKETVPVSIETGLLSHIRKIICLLPDTQVRKVLGPILDQDSIVVMADHPSILVRTAVVRVLGEFFRRAGDSSQANFLQVKGFNLLGNQLKQHTLSFELVSALFSIVFGQEINLFDQSSGTFQVPQSLSGFQFNAVIPILMCIANTLPDPNLCHTTLCVLRELFEMVKLMPACMLSNGLLKMICQMIILIPESTSLSKENKQTLLTDLFNFCKLIVLYTLSAELEENFRFLETLLVCLKHCLDEIKKNRTSMTLTIVYLEQFIYHTLAEALQFFIAGPITDGGGLISPFASVQSLATQTELQTRFIQTSAMSVEWLINDTPPLTGEVVSRFTDEGFVRRGMLFDKKMSSAATVAGYTSFLLRFFHRSLRGSGKKSFSQYESSSLRYFTSSRGQLIEQFSKLLGFLLSPIHSHQFRLQLIKSFHLLDDFSSLLSLLFSSQTKKLFCGRLILTITDLMQSPNVHSDVQSMEAYNDIFDACSSTGFTRLKPSTKLSSLLMTHEDDDSRSKQRIESIKDEMKNADQRWAERMESGKKDFDYRRQTIYNKMIERLRTKEAAVKRASIQVTERVFGRQKELRLSLLGQIELAGVQEKETLRQWKKIIASITHPRGIWSEDEPRPLCWQLDPTEGPSRVRRRLMRSTRMTSEKFLLREACTGESGIRCSPLSFIFEETAYDSAQGMLMKVLRQPNEDIIGNTHQRCYIISPDSSCIGNLLITNISCYFIGDKPLGDPNIAKVVALDEKTQLMSWRHTDVVEIHRRRYMLKDNALEIFLINGITLLLSFDTTMERNKVHSGLLELDMPNLVDPGGEGEGGGKLKALTIGWQQGEISNFEYLMELNKLAGRTFNDLMQYPIFPFILSDYTSEELDLSKDSSFRILERPISIQDDSKIKKYIDRYQYILNECTNQGFMMPGLSSISSKPYHYGSHYSNSGIVLHFLVRIPPFTDMFLDFQGKSFDIADRSFHKVATTWWLSSSESATDVKELIPEFFYFPEFLTNSERFKLGEKQNGETVDHVVLPPWAKGDPRLFVLKHRQALESEYVSKHLHEWIDLVFGYKQTGRAAVNAVNVFHPATYYGADGIDVDSISDVTQQEALKTMVKTYGQMPLQLFKEPHPHRSKTTVRTTLLIRFGSILKRLTSSSSAPLKINNSIISHSMKLIKPKVSLDCVFIGQPDPPFSHRPIVTTTVPLSPERLTCLWNGEVAITDQDAAFFPSPSGTYNSLFISWGHWDNAILIRSVGISDHSITIKLHNSPLNRVTCCQVVCNGQMLVIYGGSGVVSFWKLNNTAKQNPSYAGGVTHLRGHTGPVNSLVSCKPYSIVVSGSSDCTCIIWDTNRSAIIMQLY